MRYWFPFPLLSFALLMLWLLINQSVSVAQILLGSVLAVSLAWAMVNLKPGKPRIRKPGLVFRLIGYVLVDVLRSNLAVLKIILRPASRPVNSGFIKIDIALSDETAIGILACILTATPGTAWVEFDRQTRTLLVHILDMENADRWMDVVARHYQQPLKEIFE